MTEKKIKSVKLVKEGKEKPPIIECEIEEMDEDLVEDEDKEYTRSVQVSTLNTHVIVTSTDPKDDLKKLKGMVIDLVNMYKDR